MMIDLEKISSRELQAELQRMEQRRQEYAQRHRLLGIVSLSLSLVALVLSLIALVMA